MGEEYYYIAENPESSIRIGPFQLYKAAKTTAQTINKYREALMESVSWNIYSIERQKQIRDVLRVAKGKSLKIYKIIK